MLTDTLSDQLKLRVLLLICDDPALQTSRFQTALDGISCVSYDTMKCVQFTAEEANTIKDKIELGSYQCIVVFSRRVGQHTIPLLLRSMPNLPPLLMFEAGMLLASDVAWPTHTSTVLVTRSSDDWWPCQHFDFVKDAVEAITSPICCFFQPKLSDLMNLLEFAAKTDDTLCAKDISCQAYYCNDVEVTQGPDEEEPQNPEEEEEPQGPEEDIPQPPTIHRNLQLVRNHIRYFFSKRPVTPPPAPQVHTEAKRRQVVQEAQGVLNPDGIPHSLRGPDAERMIKQNTQWIELNQAAYQAAQSSLEKEYKVDFGVNKPIYDLRKSNWKEGLRYQCYMKQQVTASFPKLTRRDLLTLHGNNWLNDNVIATYGKMLQAKFKADTYIFNSFFFTKYLKSETINPRAASVTRKVALFNHKKICIPIHVSSHWILVVLYTATWTLRLYDSGTNFTVTPNRNTILDRIKAYFLFEVQDKSSDAYKEKSNYINAEQAATYRSKLNRIRPVVKLHLPQQSGGYDCGVYMLHFLTCVCSDSVPTLSNRPSSRVEIEAARDDMAWNLLQQHLSTNPPHATYEALQQVWKENEGTVLANWFTHVELEALDQRVENYQNKRATTWDGFREFTGTSKFLNASKPPMPRGTNKIDYTMGALFLAFLKDKHYLFYSKCMWLVDFVQSNDDACRSCNVDFHIMRTQKDKRQDTHRDDPEKQCYYTIIVPLTDDTAEMGGTVFTSPDKVQAYTPNFTPDARFQWTEPTCNNNYRILGMNVLSQQCCEKFVNVYQSAVIFNGNVEHYGACNTTEDMRVFMYIVLYSGRDDSN